MKVAELKTELAARGLPLSGKKEELVDRLLEALGAPSASASPSVAGSASGLPDGNASAAGAKSPAEAFSVGAAIPPAAQTTAQTLEQDPLSLERMRARQARFGVAVSSRLTEAEESAARQRRQERFSAQK